MIIIWQISQSPDSRLIYQSLCNAWLLHDELWWKAYTDWFITKYQVRKLIHGGVLRMSSGVSQPEESSCAVVWWYCSRYFCISCQRAAGQTGWMGGWVLSFGILWALCRHLTSLISLMLSRFSRFSHPLQSLPVLSHAHSTPVSCYISLYSVKLTRNWCRNLTIFSFPSPWHWIVHDCCFCPDMNSYSCL